MIRVVTMAMMRVVSSVCAAVIGFVVGVVLGRGDTGRAGGGDARHFLATSGTQYCTSGKTDVITA